MYLEESKSQTFKENIERLQIGDNVTKTFRFNITVLQEERVTVAFNTVPVFFHRNGCCRGEGKKVYNAKGGWFFCCCFFPHHSLTISLRPLIPKLPNSTSAIQRKIPNCHLSIPWHKFISLIFTRNTNTFCYTEYSFSAWY